MKKRYSIFVMALGLALALAVPDGAMAQKSKSKTRSTRSSVTRVKTRTRSSSRSAVRARGTRTRVTNRTATTRVLRGRSTRVLRGRSTQVRTPRNTVRVNVTPARGSRGTISRYTSARTLKSRGNGNVDRDDYAARFRSRSGTRASGRVINSRRESDRREYNRRVRDRDGRRRGHGRAFERGYDRGFRHGYHSGYRVGRHYQHHHYYGGHRLFGFHFGGFGFHAGRWHFVIVIHKPVVVAHRVHHYHYSWWDGRGQSLVTYDRMVDAYPATYNFDLSQASCIELWIRTVDGKDYVIEADPRYWGARNPGDLYASLWAELEQRGNLQIEDIYGAIHVFPAGMIQQIEVAPCR
ncbi:MAG: hypothetical protein GWN32_02340 [Gemmatimonadetes bacterium]|nr:hypothetical protein [Gemmatimonadota bacterium]